MVLDEMNLREFRSGDAQGIGEWRIEVADLGEIPRAINDVGDAHAVSNRKRRLASKICFRVPTYRDVGDLISGDPADFEALLYGGSREAGPVLYPPESFFFQGNDELSITKEHS
jgi:hypothetical protein